MAIRKGINETDSLRVFFMHIYMGMSASAIADELALDVKYVRSAITRIGTALRSSGSMWTPYYLKKLASDAILNTPRHLLPDGPVYVTKKEREREAKLEEQRRQEAEFERRVADAVEKQLVNSKRPEIAAVYTIAGHAVVSYRAGYNNSLSR